MIMRNEKTKSKRDENEEYKYWNTHRSFEEHRGMAMLNILEVCALLKKMEGTHPHILLICLFFGLLLLVLLTDIIEEIIERDGSVVMTILLIH